MCAKIQEIRVKADKWLLFCAVVIMFCLLFWSCLRHAVWLVSGLLLFIFNIDLWSQRVTFHTYCKLWPVLYVYGWEHLCLKLSSHVGISILMTLVQSTVESFFIGAQWTSGSASQKWDASSYQQTTPGGYQQTTPVGVSAPATTTTTSASSTNATAIQGSSNLFMDDEGEWGQLWECILN